MKYESGTMVGKYWRGKTTALVKTPPKRATAHHKYHMDQPRSNPELLVKRPATNRQSHRTAHVRQIFECVHTALETNSAEKH